VWGAGGTVGRDAKRPYIENPHRNFLEKSGQTLEAVKVKKNKAVKKP
jgi:hypothetical protein